MKDKIFISHSSEDIEIKLYTFQSSSIYKAAASSSTLIYFKNGVMYNIVQYRPQESSSFMKGFFRLLHFHKKQTIEISIQTPLGQLRVIHTPQHHKKQT